MATDIGFPDPALVERFLDSAALVIESNHDLAMLENSGRPMWLKRRIREIGHLSNDECAQLVIDIVERSRLRPESVVLAHISQQCNTNAHAVRSTSAALSRRGFHEVRVVETFRHRPSEIVSL
jgi:phosphoribosyl 1,2-cyclic phosphodiesterase